MERAGDNDFAVAFVPTRIYEFVRTVGTNMGTYLLFFTHKMRTYVIRHST